MKAVPVVQGSPSASLASSAQTHSVQEEAGAYRVGDGWLTPERLARRKAAYERSPEETERLARQWESENQDVIDSMNQHYEAVGSMGWRIHELRTKQAVGVDTAAAAVQLPTQQRRG